MKQAVIMCLLCMFLFPLMHAVTGSNAELASKAYKNKQFEQALKLYTQMETQGIYDADLFYNMGNCYYRLQKTGAAILYYKRALRLDSSHASARKNLALAMSQTRDQQYQTKTGFIGQVIGKVLAILTLNRIAILILITLALIAGMIYYIWVLNHHDDKLLYIFILILLLFFLAVWSIIGIVKYHQYVSHKEAVLVLPSEIGYSGPGVDFTRVFTIHEGMNLIIAKEEGGWMQVKLPNGLGGWIPDTSATRVNPM